MGNASNTLCLMQLGQLAVQRLFENVTFVKVAKQKTIQKITLIKLQSCCPNILLNDLAVVLTLLAIYTCVLFTNLELSRTTVSTTINYIINYCLKWIKYHWQIYYFRCCKNAQLAVISFQYFLTHFCWSISDVYRMWARSHWATTRTRTTTTTSSPLPTAGNWATKRRHRPRVAVAGRKAVNSSILGLVLLVMFNTY